MVNIYEIEETEKNKNDYSSSHDILLVGEGDFSFALSLARAMASASNILATSLDSYDEVTRKYKKAKSNLESLEKLGASLLHRVDATTMKLHPDLKMRKFDRIIFNFPHAGFHGKEDHHHLIKMHRRLVQGFFHNACGLLRLNGEIHVNHKTSAPFCHWNLEQLASQNSLLLIKCVPFKIQDYPGYNNKRGDGKRCDEPFPLGECSTFKFIISRMPSTHDRRKNKRESLSQPLEKIQLQENHVCPCTKFENSANLSSGEREFSVCYKFREELSWIFNGYFDYVEEMFGMSEERIEYNVHEAVTKGYERFIDMASDRPLGDFIVFLEELHGLSCARIEWLKQKLESMSCN